MKLIAKSKVTLNWPKNRESNIYKVTSKKDLTFITGKLTKRESKGRTRTTWSEKRKAADNQRNMDTKEDKQKQMHYFALFITIKYL